MMMMVLLLSAALADTPHANCPMQSQHAAAADHSDMADHAACPMHAEHAASVDHNHDSFGFSHEATTHHFRVLAGGGAIDLQANDEADTKSAAAIRAHLREVAGDFAKNDFEKPMFVHGKAPDGLETMKAKHASISYTYEELPRGGRVRITTGDAVALAAVHQFLRFQIVEHRTGDPAEVAK